MAGSGKRRGKGKEKEKEKRGRSGTPRSEGSEGSRRPSKRVHAYNAPPQENVTRALGGLSLTSFSPHGAGAIPSRPPQASDPTRIRDNYYDRPQFPAEGSSPFGEIVGLGSGLGPEGRSQQPFGPAELWYVRMAMASDWRVETIAANLQRPTRSILQQIDDFASAGKSPRTRRCWESCP